MIIVAIYGIYFRFFQYMRSNRESLDNPSMRAKIGSLYEPFETMKSEKEHYNVEYYSLVFHLRRSLFVLTTFMLYSYPGLQVMSFMQTSILYMVYVGHVPYFREIRTKRLEIFNEFIGIVMCYSYLLFANIVSDRQQRRNIGM